MPHESGAVVVVGSLHYDIFVEAPHRPAAGETVTGQRWYPKFGGKGGNQALAIAAQGCATRLVSAVGEDDFADFLVARLTSTGVDSTRVARVPSVGTGMSVAISDADGDYGAVIVSGANLRIDPEVLGEDELWAGASYLVLQNEVSDEINLAAAKAARARGVRVCLNAAPWREMGPEFLSLVDLLIVNSLEAEALCGLEVSSLETASAAASRLAERFPCAIVTAGGAGVAFASGKDVAALPALKVEVVSTHGAGDHFTGSVIAHVAAGANPAEAVEFANRSAAMHVSHRREDT